jgi:group I intron endonuclease
MNDVLCGIYLIENLTNNKKYIGQSVNIYQRWYDHQYLLKSNSHYNIHLQSAWNKYGTDAFRFSVLELCDVCNLDDREKYYIQYYQSYMAELGYNLTLGGEGGVPTNETRQKMSEAHIGLIGTTESRAKQSEALTGANNPMFGRCGALSPTYGRKKSVDEIQKMIETRWTAQKRKINSERILGVNNPMYGRFGSQNAASRAVRCIETNEIFESIQIAARWCGLASSPPIGQVCLGKRKSAGKHPITGEKLHWEYVD